MTPDWRNTLFITGAAVAIGSTYLLIPTDDPIARPTASGYAIVQCLPECPAHFQDGVSWPVLPLSLGIGLTASAALAWFRTRRHNPTAD